MQAFEPVPTWRQPMPPPASAEQIAVIARVAGRIARDRDTEGEAEAARLHRDRYQVAQAIYLTEARPRARADVIIDNRDLTRPVIVGPAASR